MAEASPGGLFGPTVDELRQLIDERGRADTLALHANAVNPLGIVAGNIANAGRSFGGALEALGGYERPELVRARKMNEARQAVMSMGISPEADPIGFARAASRELSRRGLGDEAFGAALYAKKMQDEMAATEWEKEAKRGDWQNRLDVERMRGEYDLSVAGMRGGGGGSGGGGGAPKAYDQNEAKAFAEQFMRSPEAQALYQTPGVLYGTNLDEKALQVAADEFGREVETLITLGVPAGIAYNTAMARRTSGRGGGVGEQADPNREAGIQAIITANKKVLGGRSSEEQRAIAEKAYDAKKRGVSGDVSAAPPAPTPPRTGPIAPEDVMNIGGLTETIKGAWPTYGTDTEVVPRTGATSLPTPPDPLKLQEHYDKWKKVNPSGRSGVVKYPDSLKKEMKEFYDKNRWKMSVNERNKFRAYARMKGLVLPE